MPKYAMTGTRVVPIIVLVAYMGAGAASVGGYALCVSHHDNAGPQSVREYCEDNDHRHKGPVRESRLPRDEPGISSDQNDVSWDHARAKCCADTPVNSILPQIARQKDGGRRIEISHPMQSLPSFSHISRGSACSSQTITVSPYPVVARTIVLLI